MSDKWLPLLLALLCVVLSAGAQLAMKAGMSSAAPTGAGLGQTYGQALTSAWVWAGLVLYGLSAVLWLWVLSRLDVGLAYPLVSVGFVLTMWAGVWWLGEPWSWQRLAGAALIIAGVLVLATDA
jgi:multidrug transporter EmrE-like cation transporter